MRTSPLMFRMKLGRERVRRGVDSGRESGGEAYNADIIVVVEC